jgi:hypothetical protein
MREWWVFSSRGTKKVLALSTLNKAKAWSAQDGLETKSVVNRGMTHAEAFNPVQNNPFERAGRALIWIWKRTSTTNIRTKYPVNGSPREIRTQGKKLQERKNKKHKLITKHRRWKFTTKYRHRRQVIGRISTHGVYIWHVGCLLWSVSAGQRSGWRWVEEERPENPMVWNVWWWGLLKLGDLSWKTLDLKTSRYRWIHGHEREEANQFDLVVGNLPTML